MNSQITAQSAIDQYVKLDYSIAMIDLDTKLLRSFLSVAAEKPALAQYFLWSQNSSGRREVLPVLWDEQGV